MRRHLLIAPFVGAFILFTSLCPPAAARGGRGKAARAFRAGSRLFKGGSYQKALSSFTRAYALKPHYAVQCNIARCHERLRQAVAASKHYQRCLDEGGKRKRATARQIRAKLRELEALIAHYTIKAGSVGGVVFVDRKRVGPAPLTVPLDQGLHYFEVRKDGMRPARMRVRAVGGERREVSMVPVALDEEDDVPSKAPRVETDPSVTGRDGDDVPMGGGISQAWFWVGLAVTAVLTATATGFGIKALGAKSDYDDNPTPDGYHDAIDARLVANIFWAAAIVAGAGTTTLFFLTDFHGGGGGEYAAGHRGFAMGIGIQGRF